MRSSSGFTLIEVMIVVVIIGIMSSYGIAVFTKKLENDRVRKATENLKVIYNIEKRYKLEQEQYFPIRTVDAGTVSCAAADIAAINTGLGLYLRDTEFTYQMDRGAGATCAAGSTTTAYRVFATRVSGKCAGATITLTSAGGDPVMSNCALWQ